MKRAPLRPDFSRNPSVGSPIFWHFAARFAPWLVALVVYLFAATLLIRWDAARNGEAHDDFGADLYGVYTQLFFEPTASLPRSPLARAVFWVTPLLGAGLILRGVVRVGTSVFDVEERRKLWVKIMTDRMKGHIVVCGVGHVGIRVIESLKALGASVVAIDREATTSFAASAEAMGVPVLYGDVRRDELLREAGVHRAKAIVCATDHDLTNLEVAIDAKRDNPEIRVVMRMFDQRVASKMRVALHVDETFSTSALSGPLVALQAIEPGVVAVYQVEDGTMRVDMEATAPASWWGRTVAECEDTVDGRVISVRRDGGTSFRARHDTMIEPGDVMMIDLPAANIGALRPAPSRRTLPPGPPR